jgi:serine/threonine-protein kinase
MPSDLSDVFGLLGTDIENKYRVSDVVGEGGFGVVYRGWHRSFERPIAIKCLKVPPHFTSEAQQLFLENFRQEGRLLDALSTEHSSIVRVYDFGVTETSKGRRVPYLVLEWLDGVNLEDELAERSKSLGELEAVELLRPAVEALGKAHAMDPPVAHRDVKPANLFLAETKEGRRLKVLDFGIAKAMQEGERATQRATRTSSGFRAFSPKYGAPEQYLSKKFGPTGPWTDVHALGLVLVELVTGEAALEGEDQFECVGPATSKKRPTPRSRGVVVSDAFEEMCEKAIALHPTDRYGNASELLSAMDRILKASQPPIAHRSKNHPPDRTEPAIADNDSTELMAGSTKPANLRTQMPVTIPRGPSTEALVGSSRRRLVGESKSESERLAKSFAKKPRAREGSTTVPPNTDSPTANMSMSGAVLLGVAALVAGVSVGWGLRDARAEDGASKAVVAADDNSSCDKWKDEICGETSQESAACVGAKAAAEFLPTSACQAALADVQGTLDKVKTARGSCDQLETKLCTHLGEDSPGCRIVRAKTPSIPPEGCEEMLGNYDAVLGQLKQMGQSQPGPGGPCPTGMVSIPRGTFQMGSNIGDEQPVHAVTVDAFCMDVTEVTVDAYASCVRGGGCNTSSLQGTGVSLAETCNWGQSGKGNHPMNCVDWNQATAYCRWANKRLPTEEEWEYGARGTDGRKYPWGDEAPGPRLLNACGIECVAWLRARSHHAGRAMYSSDDGWATTAPVGSYPSGDSPFGLKDMAGNVWEWTSSGYSVDYSMNRATDRRIYRGGSWDYNDPSLVRAAYRLYNFPTFRDSTVGFRCAR